MILGAQRGPRGEPRLGIIRNTPGNTFLALGSRSEVITGRLETEIVENFVKILISSR
jgi:hypothetical protein